ncbi:MAG: hypothetical protein QG614_609 [Patescibacteria group bacterium]|nr:hypothetical protein [Patescibacteria group bacterium]
MEKGYFTNIEENTIQNELFRKVLYTAENMQLVLMTLRPGEEIGLETHEDNDQFFRFEGGVGNVIINETKYTVHDGDAIIIPKGSKHNVINVGGSEDLKMYTIYATPHHKDGTLHSTKEESEQNEEEYDGITTE